MRNSRVPQIIRPFIWSNCASDVFPIFAPGIDGSLRVAVTAGPETGLRPHEALPAPLSNGSETIKPLAREQSEAMLYSYTDIVSQGLVSCSQETKGRSNVRGHLKVASGFRLYNPT
jgi:hypothetical protein